MKNIIVIGGGASGLMAAYHAAGAGHRVHVFEKQKKIGRKILVTGNGRCNITNLDIDERHYHGHNPKFVKNVFARFGFQETRDFFYSCGVPFIEGKEGRHYPASLQASAIPDMFEYELSRRNVKIHLHRKIESVRKVGEGFSLVTAGREKFNADAVILSQGSCAYPSVGAARSAYDIARSIGHRIYEPFPIILPLNILDKPFQKAQGVKWDCALELIFDKKVQSRSLGEVLFTSFGISGPAALEISRMANWGILNGKNPRVMIDFFPYKTAENLKAILANFLSDRERSLGLCLRGMLNLKLCNLIINLAGLSPETKASMCKETHLKKIVSLLKGLEVFCGKPRGFNEAVAAAGGVDVNEIYPGTMESRIQKRVYITGELLDIDGDSGGFNLQFAWSTGAIAGISARESLS